MNKIIRRLSRSSFGQSSTNDSEMVDTSKSFNQSLPDSLINDSDCSSMEESQPPQVPPPPPPCPPPRRRRKQTAIFYSTALPLNITYEEVRPTKRPPVPPPIPPRTVSISSECAQKMDDMAEESVSEDSACSFSNVELIENLTQNLSVMEQLNENLRNELKRCRDENLNLVNELAAIHIERNQLLQTCKEIETLKDNEWVCSICLDDRPLIVSTNRQIVSTLCGHLFCNDCVNMALEVESVCPTCRKAVSTNGKRALPFIFLYF